MPDENAELTFPSIKFPIVTDLRVNASELAARCNVPPPESLDDVTAIILANEIVNLFGSDRIGHRPGSGDDESLDSKGACFLYIIGTAMCRVLVEQGHEIELAAVYDRSGRAIFQGCPEERITRILDEGQRLGDRLFEEAIGSGEIYEFVLFVMSLGLLYSIEPRGGAMDGIVSLFEQIKGF